MIAMATVTLEPINGVVMRRAMSPRLKRFALQLRGSC